MVKYNKFNFGWASLQTPLGSLRRSPCHACRLERGVGHPSPDRSPLTPSAYSLVSVPSLLFTIQDCQNQVHRAWWRIEFKAENFTKSIL